jgi:hypothetical protein
MKIISIKGLPGKFLAELKKPLEDLIKTEDKIELKIKGGNIFGLSGGGRPIGMNKIYYDQQKKILKVTYHSTGYGQDILINVEAKDRERIEEYIQKLNETYFPNKH